MEQYKHNKLSGLPTVDIEGTEFVELVTNKGTTKILIRKTKLLWYHSLFKDNKLL